MFLWMNIPYEFRQPIQNSGYKCHKWVLGVGLKNNPHIFILLDIILSLFIIYNHPEYLWFTVYLLQCYL